MTQPRNDLAAYVDGERTGLSVLAHLIDESIRAVSNERDEKFAGRHNPHLVHAMIRERVVLAAEGSLEFFEAGLTLNVREGDSIQVCGSATAVRPKVLHKPAHGSLAPEGVFDFENSELFDQPGKPYIFYSMKGGRLARLIVAQVITSESRFGWRCEWIDEEVIYDFASSSSEDEDELQGVDTSSRVIPLIIDNNDDDPLDGLAEPKTELSSQDAINENEEPDGEQDAESGNSSA
jgi:hypothetical protein